MAQVICVGKIRDNSGKILGYKLRSADGRICKVQAFDLKESIRNGSMQVENLAMTRDNRLIDTKTTGLASTDLDTIKNWIQSVSSTLISKYSHGKLNKYGQGTLKGLKGSENCNKIQVDASIADIIRSSWPIYLNIRVVDDHSTIWFRASVECEAFQDFNITRQAVKLSKPLNSKNNTEILMKYCDVLLNAYMKQLNK